MAWILWFPFKRLAFYPSGEQSLAVPAWIASCDRFCPCTLPQKPATVTEKKQQLGYLGRFSPAFGRSEGMITPWGLLWVPSDRLLPTDRLGGANRYEFRVNSNHSRHPWFSLEAAHFPKLFAFFLSGGGEHNSEDWDHCSRRGLVN